MDSVYSLALGRRKSWVVPIQLCSATALLLSANWADARLQVGVGLWFRVFERAFVGNAPVDLQQYRQRLSRCCCCLLQPRHQDSAQILQPGCGCGGAGKGHQNAVLGSPTTRVKCIRLRIRLQAADVGAITALFFGLVLLAATQDIAVDGWALTLLSRHHVG